MKNFLQEYTSIAKELAIEGGKILQKYWGKLSDIRTKKYGWDLVTEADTESEKVIIDGLKKHFPSHAILAEEAGRISKDSEYLWIIDPLDGTTNYTHQFPLVCISIALQYKKEMIAGIVYNPILNELFSATKGMGATLNDQSIRVSSIKSLNKSLLSTGFAYDRMKTSDTNYPEFCHLTNLSQGVRRGGSAALDLAYVAAGRFDGFWERGLQPWDIAAGILLIEEAGGKVSSYEGDLIVLESGRILASNGLIHEKLIEELHTAQFPN